MWTQRGRPGRLARATTNLSPTPEVSPQELFFRPVSWKIAIEVCLLLLVPILSLKVRYGPEYGGATTPTNIRGAGLYNK